MMQKRQAAEEAKMKLLKIKSESILDELREEDILSDPTSPVLSQIREDEDEELLDEGRRLIRRSENGKTVELHSPSVRGVIKIRNCKVPIASDALRFQELKHIENQMSNMTAMPDFGYDGDNFVIDRPGDAPRNWRLLTDFVYNKDKYEWLQNHLTLRQIRKQVDDQS